VRLNRPASRAGEAEEKPLAVVPVPRVPGSDGTGPSGIGLGGTGFGGGAASTDLEPIGQILIRQQILTQDQITGPLLAQPTSGKRLGPLLIELGLIDERQLTAALAEQLRLDTVDLRQITPNPTIVPRLAESYARELEAIPLYEDPDGSVVVAVYDPTDTVAADLRRALGGPVRLVLAPGGEIRRAIAGAYRVLVGVDEHVAAFTAGQRPVAAAPAAHVSADDAPVVQVVNKLITQALRDRASDIHVEPQDTGIRVRFRIDGALHDVLTLPSSMASAVTSRIKIMAGMNIVERRRPQDGQIAITLEGRALDIRVATAGMIWGEKVVMRLLDKSRPMFKLGDLGMPLETHATYSKMIRSPHGMVICAGPTGSGKTTTLYASLSEVNGPERNITTIEDPVEYIFPQINQIQINEQAGITFAEGLRAILRQDPDMILVGEIRDVETARIAVQSALTGHFVLSSLHATDAVSALYRFLDMGIESFLVSSSVLGVVGQRLVRRTCPDCKVRYSPTGEELEFMEQAGGGGKTEFWAGEGCNFCARTGYSDRIGVYEVLRVTEEMRELIVRPNPSHDEMRKLAISQGMRPIRAEGVRLVTNDVTTISEIVRSIYTL
jgi:type IV pilus assembly protein PilB